MRRTRGEEGAETDIVLPVQPLTFRRSKMAMNISSSTAANAPASASAIAFYQAFLSSPNFQTWYMHRSETTEITTRSRYLQRLESESSVQGREKQTWRATKDGIYR